MATFNFTGAISGLDTSSIMSALLNAEKAPLVRLQNQRTTLKATQSAYGDLQGLLAKLESAAKVFTRDLGGAKRSASSSAANVLSAAAGTAAVPASYQVTVDRLATSTRATSTASIGTALTDADLGTALANLPLPGSVTQGTASVVVDGQIVQVAVGNPATATLGDVLGAIADAITTKVQASEGGGSTATATASIVGNKVQLAISGATGSHTVSFGAGGDTSNALGILGLAGSGTLSLSDATPIAGRLALGVARASVPLNGAGLTGLASGTGTLSVNGAAIAYDTTTDSLSTVIGRINASAAGVVASLDRANDKIVLTARGGGASPIAITDTGSLASALRLAPGTTDAQVLGVGAQVTVDGQVYTSDTNKVSTAITGVTLNLLSLGTSTVTIAPDDDALTSAVSDLVTAYNALADKLDTLAANDPKGTKGPLSGETEVRGLALSLRRSLLGSTSLPGSFTSLSQIGVTTGAVGASVGTTSRLAFDPTKLKAAIEQDPSAVADLLNSAQGAVKPMLDRVTDWTKTGGRIATSLASIATTLRDYDRRETQLQDRIDQKQTALEAKFANLERTLAELQTQSNSLASQAAQSNKG